MLAQRFTAALSGLVFGLGLAISGMANPAKILNFLDFAGPFDATLLFVFAAGVGTAALGYFLTFKRKAPLFAAKFMVPLSDAIDQRLLAGAAIFGLGWGISGICPGPAMASLAWMQPMSVVLLLAMAAGSYAARFVAE